MPLGATTTAPTTAMTTPTKRLASDSRLGSATLHWITVQEPVELEHVVEPSAFGDHSREPADYDVASRFVASGSLTGHSAASMTHDMNSSNPALRAADPGPASDAKSDVWPILLMVVSAAAFAVVAWLALAKAGDFTPDATVGLVAALVPGLISVVVAAFGYLDRTQAAAERERFRDQETRERESIRDRETKEREVTRYEEIVLKSLDFFTGKTQRRNVGISIVQGAWDRTTHLRPVFVPLLVNQAVYLLEESGQDEARHEKENLDRIMQLVIASVATDDFPQKTYQRLDESLERRIDGQSPGKGVAVSGAELARWRNSLLRPVR